MDAALLVKLNYQIHIAQLTGLCVMFVATILEDRLSCVMISILMTVLGVLQTAWMSFLNGSALEGQTQPPTSALPNMEMELSLETSNAMTETL